MMTENVSYRSVDIGLGSEGVTSPCEEDSHSSAAEVTLKLHSNIERPANLTEAESEAEPGQMTHYHVYTVVPQVFCLIGAPRVVCKS